MRRDVDLVIVGYGAAGAATALAAARIGATVALVEKQPADAHYPSLRGSGGLIMAAHDVDGATTYLDACSGGMIPLDVSRAWAERSVGLADWLREIGIETVRMATAWFPSLPGFDAIEVLAPLPRGIDPDSVEVELPPPGELSFRGPVPFGNGQLLHELLADAVSAETNVTPYFAHRALRLLQEHDAVVGVASEAADGLHELRARHGVVLASGGFENDPKMILNYLKAYPIYFYGAETNTGDGIRMAQAVGADLWHMNQMIGRCVGHFVHADGRESTYNLALNPPGYVIVDKYGRRFVNEYLQAVTKPNVYYELLQFDADLLEYPRIPSYWIFDQRRFEARPIAHSAFGWSSWSSDNQAELDAGWVKQGATVEEALDAAGNADPEAAAQTVADYNAGCALGVDALGRPAATLVPLDRPPYYCVPVYPGGATTNGGPRRDAQSRVLDPYGQPIPGLYAAGELGGPIGLLYPSPGSNLGEAFCFGPIAAETALGGLNAEPTAASA